jgi:hypothetical protein
MKGDHEMTDRDRLARVFGAALAGMTYDEFIAWESTPVAPPVEQDRGHADQGDDEHSGDGPVPLGVPRVDIGEDHEDLR